MAPLVSSPVKTFSIGFREAAYNELDYARLAARALGTEHHDLVLEPDAIDTLEDLAWYLDEPFGDPSAIPTYMVSRLASEHVKVVLSGDGGDELFAGYDKYRVEKRERTYEVTPAPLRTLLGGLGRLAPQGMRGRNFLRHVALSGWERYLDASTLFRQDEKRKLFRPEVMALVADYDPWREALAHLGRANGGWLSSAQYLDLMSYLPLDILTKVDRMSMAHSIEARVPLLDHELVEFVARIPPEMKLRGTTGKYIFKRAMRGILPDAIIDRPKKGFAVPLEAWFRGRLADFVSDLLLAERARRRRIFDPAYVQGLLQRCRTQRRLDGQIWTLLSFEMWCRTFLDRAPSTMVREAPRVARGTALAMAAAR
jgi:asparagine synthase (glutamine-hydrolysing)